MLEAFFYRSCEAVVFAAAWQLQDKDKGNRNSHNRRNKKLMPSSDLDYIFHFQGHKLFP
jgi:hypothetical protein